MNWSDEKARMNRTGQRCNSTRLLIGAKVLGLRAAGARQQSKTAAGAGSDLAQTGKGSKGRRSHWPLDVQGPPLVPAAEKHQLQFLPASCAADAAPTGEVRRACAVAAPGGVWRRKRCAVVRG